MSHTVVFGTVIGDAPVSYWLSLITVPEVFAKVNSARVLSRL